MIEKLTDFDSLSGVSSPLLPLIYAEGTFSRNDLNGGFVQKSRKEEIQAVFSLKNTCVTLHLLNDANIEELENFFSFCGVTEILSDEPLTRLCNTQKKLNLLKLFGEHAEETDCLKINAESTISEYKNIYNVVFENGDNFENWFPEFSKKVNSFNSFATYAMVEDRVISVSISPAIYKNVAIVAGVYTLKEYRNKGFATKCVKSLLNELKEHNTSKIYLWCEDNNLSFYEKNGFKAVDIIYFGECK